MADKRTRIYVMTHRAFETPSDPMYVPLHVGRGPWRADNAAAEPNGGGTVSAGLLEYVGDDTGDHISDRNCYYSELTGLYWVWKNVRDVDFVGTCHYRRYLLNQRGYMFTAAEIEELLLAYDVITTKSLQLNYSYYEGFAANHKSIYLDVTAQVLAERFPGYYGTYEKLVCGKHTYFGNMLICKKELYDAYCEWLFDVLFEVEKRVKVEEEDSYHRRIFGFISEFLQYVWVCHNGYRAYGCMVGMLGEKAEVAEVKSELKKYFEEGDYAGAKEFFLEARRRRPDILMEASDVTGELHLCMEIISIAGLEQEAYGCNLLDRIRDFGELMSYGNRLNRYAVQLLKGTTDEELAAWAKSIEVTEVAVEAAKSVMGAIVGESRFSGF